MSGPHVLVARLDSMGDVLICGPAVRAVAARAGRVTMLVSSRGAPAAELLPGVDDIIGWDCPWITVPAPPVDADDLVRMQDAIRAAAVDEALVLTSFHQSALPTALMLQQAGVRHIAAISEHYPGNLLSSRLAEPPDAPEPVRMLSAAAAAGYPLPADDDGRLAVEIPEPAPQWLPGEGYVVVHPGTDAPARAYPLPSWQRLVEQLTGAGQTVVVTGAPADAPLGAALVQSARPPGRALDLTGQTDVAALAAVLARADVVVAANTGPAHLAAAVGTPVVSLFAPVVPAVRWAPYGVPTIVLGDQKAACAGSRAAQCPVPGHPCLAGVAPESVVAAVEQLRPALVSGVRR
jgi:ADP-heptose:LPS heptosyltransferase